MAIAFLADLTLETVVDLQVKHRSNTGQTLVKNRSNTGQTLVKRLVKRPGTCVPGPDRLPGHWPKAGPGRTLVTVGYTAGQTAGRILIFDLLTRRLVKRLYSL